MFDYTKRLAGLLIVGTVFFTACNSSSETTPTDRVSLGIHQSGRVGTDVAVRVDSIQDSRCPMDANCIWAGEAKVKLLLANDSDSTTVRLAIGAGIKPSDPDRRDSTGVLLGNSTYKVLLREVNPYPSTSTVGQPQTAVVQVTKL
ncbi:hypothetical protein WBJ53_23050 [Spirosoma sp. SC4-14]|uniref:hypothetical protein n=1 Tax=Spirosoma sp. SC4-14 TaxID=3128900 RepID=UPI0030D17DD5